MLCAHSDAFNDMFGVVDPTAGEAFDGCPVIELLDSGEDVYNMLRAIHFREFGRVESEPPFSLIASLLRMSTKYMIDCLRAEMISILSAIFPVTLEAYESSSHAYHPRNIDPIMAVHLGLSYNVPSIIPLACYLVCLMDARDFVTAQIDAPLLPSWKACVLYRESFMAAMKICVRESCQAVACCFPTAQPSVAWRSPACRTFYRKCPGITDDDKYALELASRRLAFDILKQPKPKFSVGANACDPCKASAARYWSEVRRRVWKALPKLCGFKNWHAVKTAQAD